MKLLLLSDLHYNSNGISKIPERKVKFGVEILKRIIRRISEKKIDVIIIGGDLLDDGKSPDVEKDYSEIKRILQESNFKGILVAPGNHDFDLDRFKKFFKEYKFLIYDEFLFYVFYDKYYEDERCYRDESEIEVFEKIIKDNPGKKVIVIQHYIIQPEIKSDYPFNINYSEKIHNLYRKNNVFLSISGHYHRGINLFNKDGIYYFVLPAVCEEPFNYFELEIGSDIKIKEGILKNNIEIIDHHCHTEFGYCAEDVSMEKVIERCNLFGVKKIYFTEHAGQLYLSPDDYWNFKFFNNTSLIKKQREENKDRIGEYVKRFKLLNSPIGGIGLEVEIDKEGNITLLEEDRNFFEILIGAVHYLPEEMCVSKNITIKNFLWAVEKLVENRINILAHPFRFFFRKKIETPKEIYKDVIKILKDGNVKAEVNFHHYYPEKEFFKMCREEEVEIVFGSDSHNLIDIGEFSEYIKFIKEISS
ncbi:MAG: metallophosphoesterase [bacterium]|nr:metallophosphoesterase [bacterium]MDW8163883.1 metallophosphoesterase [Candidatus Omnitrophota bacterium]